MSDQLKPLETEDNPCGFPFITDMSTQSDSFCIQTSSVLARKDLFAFKDSMIYLISVTMCTPPPGRCEWHLLPDIPFKSSRTSFRPSVRPSTQFRRKHSFVGKTVSLAGRRKTTLFFLSPGPTKNQARWPDCFRLR